MSTCVHMSVAPLWAASAEDDLSPVINTTSVFPAIPHRRKEWMVL